MVTHPGIAHSYEPEASELPEGLTKVRVAQQTTQTLPSMILSSLAPTTGPARICLGPDPSRRVEILGNVQFIRETLPKFRQKVSVFSKWARHRGMSGIPKDSSRIWGKFGAGPFSWVVTHPGIAPASNSLNFGVPTNPKPVSSQKASYYIDARCAI
ncbi:hypothetical protein L3X38_037892 [Prunus dulcis]|uniref:Uncharacterized protein n=1 Tax=Prunus dulcis TaxID=3755 RepID=A0AAD4V5G9_PRUDU|nr:hypothetical protein L3X38_037892 [Prunus dulcis]